MCEVLVRCELRFNLSSFRMESLKDAINQSYILQFKITSTFYYYYGLLHISIQRMNVWNVKIF